MFCDGQEAALFNKTSPVLVGVGTGISDEAESVDMEFLSQMAFR